MVQLIYREAFQRQNLGTAAAMSVIVLAVLLILNAIQFRGLRVGDGLSNDDAALVRVLPDAVVRR